MPAILALRRLKQEGHRFKTSLGYIARPCLRKIRAGNVECLPSMHKARSLIPNIAKTKMKAKTKQNKKTVYHKLIIDHPDFHIRNGLPICHHFISLCLNSFSISVDIPLLDISFKWNHTIHVAFCA
jgi:hypothetical protein